MFLAKHTGTASDDLTEIDGKTAAETEKE